jgi:hypothetical protein
MGHFAQKESGRTEKCVRVSIASYLLKGCVFLQISELQKEKRNVRKRKPEKNIDNLEFF